MNKLFFISAVILFASLLYGKASAGNIIEDIDDVSIFSVYQLSAQTTAIVSNMDESAGEPSLFDEMFLSIEENDKLFEDYYNSVYDNKHPVHLTFKDTTGIFPLLYNKKVADNIKPLVTNSFFVYGTKGMENHVVEDVVFSLDECRTNFFAFTIGNFDQSKNGCPMMASDKELNLTYGKDYQEIEKKINDFYGSMELDYRDHIPVKVYAHMENLYFTYNDDFKWNSKDREEDPACLFPDRAIFSLNDDGTLELFWYDGLDLYGIPCD